MGEVNIERVTLTRLRTIPTESGYVRHVLRKSESDFSAFGEAYFSYVEQGQIRGWKKHNRMTMNLVVPTGNIKFVFHQLDTAGKVETKTFDIGENNFARLMVPPGIWFAFKGLSAGLNTVLNISNIEHDPAESEKLPLDHFPFDC